MDPDHQSKHTSQSEGRHDSDQVHQSDAFVVEGQCPAKESRGMIQEVMLGIAVDFAANWCRYGTIYYTHCFDLGVLV